MSIDEFLLARITEDEQIARAATPGPWESVEMYPDVCYVQGSDGRNVANESSAGDIAAPDALHIARHDPARVLAECAVKRAIVHQFAHLEQDQARLTDARLHLQWHVLGTVVEHLAQAFAAHPEFDPAWPDTPTST